MDLNALLKTVTGKRTELEARSGKNNAVKPPPGKSRWRILPGWREGRGDIFFHDWSQHWIKDAEGTVVAVIVSERETFGREDPTADALEVAIRAATDDKLIKLLKEMKGKRRVLVNAVRTDGSDANPKVAKLMEMPSTVFDAFLNILQERLTEEGGVNILDPDTGKDVVITRTGSGFDTEYAVNDVSRSTKVDPDALASRIDIDAWIENERTRGLSKIALVAPTLRTLLSGASPAALAIPSASALVPARRAAPIIEADDAEMTVAAPVKTKAPAKSPAAVATEAELVAASLPDAPLNDDDIEKLLAGL